MKIFISLWFYFLSSGLLHAATNTMPLNLPTTESIGTPFGDILYQILIVIIPLIATFLIRLLQKAISSFNNERLESIIWSLIIYTNKKFIGEKIGEQRKEWVMSKLPFLTRIFSKNKASLLIDTLHAQFELELEKKSDIAIDG